MRGLSTKLALSAALLALAGCLHGPVTSYPDGGQLVCDQGEICGPGTHCYQGFCILDGVGGDAGIDGGLDAGRDGGPDAGSDAGLPDAACVAVCLGRPCGTDDGCGSICIPGGNPSGCNPASFVIQKGALSPGAGAASSAGLSVKGALAPASESSDSNYRVHAGKVGP
jgi:hypothetical protein